MNSSSLEVHGPRVTTRAIVRVTAAVYGVPERRIVLHNVPRHANSKPLFGEAREVEARHVAAYLARRLTGRSQRVIANVIGWHDHSTVHYAINHIAGRLAAGDAHRVAAIMARLVLDRIAAPLPPANLATPAILAH